MGNRVLVRAMGHWPGRSTRWRKANPAPRAGTELACVQAAGTLPTRSIEAPLGTTSHAWFRLSRRPRPRSPRLKPHASGRFHGTMTMRPTHPGQPTPSIIISTPAHKLRRERQCFGPQSTFRDTSSPRHLLCSVDDVGDSAESVGMESVPRYECSSLARLPLAIFLFVPGIALAQKSAMSCMNGADAGINPVP